MPVFDPPFPLYTLAFRAMPVAAAVIADAKMAATIAGIYVPAKCLSTATGNCIKYTGVIFQQPCYNRL